MSESADTPRVTPYRLIFGPEVFDATRFEAVRAEADQHGAIGADELFMLPAAGELLTEMVPATGGKDVVAQVKALLFHAYVHWRHGRHVYRLPVSMLRDLIAGESVPPVTSPPAAESGYMQLPRNIVWASVADEVPPEPVDGFFWNAPSTRPDDDGGGAPGRLDLLFTLGVRAGRPGLSLFDVSLESYAQLADWATVNARPDGEDFANVLPGGELQGYHALTTSAEAVKLAALCLACAADPAQQWSEEIAADETVHSPLDG
jgi:hypothetical protein